MVDRDKVKELKSGKGKKKEKQEKEEKKTKKKKSESSEPFHLNRGDAMSPEDGKISDRSRELAESGELNFESEGGSLSNYKRRQRKEVKELHEDMVDMAKKYSDDIAKYTLVMHAVLWNYANNRVGIANVLMDDYGMSKNKALKTAEEICESANEGDHLVQISNILSKSMMD